MLSVFGDMNNLYSLGMIEKYLIFFYARQESFPF